MPINLPQILPTSSQGAAVKKLQDVLLALGNKIPDAELKEGILGKATLDIIKKIQKEKGIPLAEKNIDAATLDLLKKEFEAINPHKVDGRILLDSGKPAAGLKVMVYDRNMSGDKLLGFAIVDKDGSYTVSYGKDKLGDKEQADLIVKIVNPAEEQKVLANSSLKVTATSDERINLLIPATSAAAAPAEYDELLAAVKPFLAGKPLSSLKEDADNQEITFLATKAAWDARMIAMAAMAEKYNALFPALKASYLYAMYRGGMNADNSFFQTHYKTADQIIDEAKQKNIIADISEKAPVLAAFRNIQAKKLMTTPMAGGLSSVEDTLRELGITSAADQEKFINTYVENIDDATKLNNAIRTNFSNDVLNKFQSLAGIGQITFNNNILAKKLAAAGVAANPLEMIKKGYHKQDKWLGHLQPDVAIPAAFGKKDDPVAKSNYSAYMARELKLRFPMQVMAQQIADNDLKLKKPSLKPLVSQFFSTESGKFVVGGSSTNKYFTENSLSYLGAQKSEVKEEVKRLERCHQMTVSDESANILLDAGIDSAYDVIQFSETDFVAKFAPLLGETEARMIYQKAHFIYSYLLQLTVAYQTQWNAPHTEAINARTANAAPGAGIDVLAYPTLDSLVGNLDFCECEHCRSVLSPAAYLVDLLEFINIKNLAAGIPNPLSVLLARRPDIQHVELSCENTNTAMPYIDVVNEMLEYFICSTDQAGNAKQEGSLVEFKSFNTAGVPSADLMANPQNVRNDAYQLLKQKKFPMLLPFDYDLEVMRLHFQHWKVPLHNAMEMFMKDEQLEQAAAASPVTYGWKEIFGEYLSLSPAEYAILTNSPQVSVAELYGLAAGTAGAAAINAALSNVKILAHTLDVTYRELLEVLLTGFISKTSAPAAAGPLQIAGPGAHPDECDMEKARLKFAAADMDVYDYRRLYRFIKLWRTTKFSIKETDIALRAFRPAGVPLTEAGLDSWFAQAIKGMGALRKVKQQLNFTEKDAVEKLIPLFSEVDTMGDKSLYAKLFLSPSVAAIDTIFKPAADGKVLQANINLSEHRFAIVSALGLTEESLNAIVSTLRAIDGNDSIDNLNLSNLSRIYQRAFLARCLKMSVKELMDIERYCNFFPYRYAFNERVHISRFIAYCQWLKAAGIKTSFLNYLLRHQDPGGKALLTEEAMLQAARKMWTETEATDAAAPNRVVSNLALQANADEEFVAALISDADILANTAGFNIPAENGATASFYFGNDIAGNANNTNNYTAIEHNATKNQLPANTVTAGGRIHGVWQYYLRVAEAGIYKFYFEADAGAEIKFFINDKEIELEKPAAEWVNKLELTLDPSALIKIRIEARKIKTLFTQQVEHQGLGKKVLPAEFMHLPASVKSFAEGLTGFMKIVHACAMLKLSATEAKAFAANNLYKISGTSFFNLLPADANTAENIIKELFEKLVLIARYSLLKTELKVKNDNFINALLNPELTENGQRYITTVCGWQAADFDYLKQYFSIDNLLNTHKLWQLHTAASVARKTGSSAEIVQRWSNVIHPALPGRIAASQEIQSALRSRYDESQWRDIIQPLNDQLRKKKRDALVACVLDFMRRSPQTRHIDTEGKLFEYFLIDVEMQPCMITSRIKQAIATVQTFINRCLLNLERSVSPGLIKANEWKWMKRYRVWEANRKIFLYPENWLEPELRDNKSFLYKDLESELLQSDITDDMAEKAFMNYIEKLDGIARLDISAFYIQKNEQDNPDDDILHLFGRTATSPYKYYYRRFEGGFWTPWAKVDLDIPSDPVLPVYWKGKLMLFWTTVVVRADEKGSLPQQSGKDTPSKMNNADFNKPPKMIADITLCWSDYFNGKWQAKKSTAQSFPFPSDKMSSDFSSKNILLLSQVSTEPADVAGALQIHLHPYRAYCTTFIFHSRNSTPVAKAYFDDVMDAYDMLTRRFFSGRRVVISGNAEGLHMDAVYLYTTTPIRQTLIYTTEKMSPETVAITQYENRKQTGVNDFNSPFFYYDKLAGFLVVPQDNSKVVTTTETVFLPIEIPLRINERIPPRLPWRPPGDPMPDFSDPGTINPGRGGFPGFPGGGFPRGGFPGRGGGEPIELLPETQPFRTDAGINIGSIGNINNTAVVENFGAEVFERTISLSKITL